MKKPKCTFCPRPGLIWRRSLYRLCYNCAHDMKLESIDAGPRCGNCGTWVGVDPCGFCMSTTSLSRVFQRRIQIIRQTGDWAKWGPTMKAASAAFEGEYEWLTKG